MKKREIVRQANIGTNVELSNIELLVIKSKWQDLYFGLMQGNSKIEQTSNTQLTHFNSFIENLCGDVLSIEETAHDLFNPREENVDDDIDDFYKIIYLFLRL